jgi:DNA polymerase type B, organellar and viral
VQKRHRHFIRPVTRVEYPKCIVAVACDFGAEGGTDVLRVSHGSLRGWTTATATLNHGDLQRVFHDESHLADSFWDYLAYVVKNHGSATIVSWQAWVDSIILGFWERLEDGRVYLSGIDPRAPIPRPRDRAKYGNGYWVLENPPSILKFRLRGVQGSLTWLDMRNFGLSALTGTQAESSQPARTLGIFLDLCAFLRERNLGGLKATSASQALYTWKYRFLRHTIHVSTDQKQNQLATDAIHGGRNECYQLGKIAGQVRQYDYNSLYPSVYVREPVPIRCREIIDSPSEWQVNSARAEKSCIARIRVETAVPCLPKKIDGRLVFPVGRFETTVCYPELELAYEHARTVRVLELGIYDLDYALRDYGEELYRLRGHYHAAESKHVGAFIKALLVSLPGKMGQRNRRWQFSPRQTAERPWHLFYARNSQDKIGRHRSVAWHVEEEIDAGLGFESVPEITAWVNSWGRRKLWEEMCNAGRNRTVYCDTDSIWVIGNAETDSLNSCRADERGLGKLRFVASYGEVTFHGLKHYTADGVATPATRIRASGDGEVRGASLIGFAGISWYCSHGVTAKIPVAQPVSTDCGEYQHGIVQPDGSVKPLVLEEW